MATADQQYQEAHAAHYSFSPDIEEKYWLAVEEYFPPGSVPGQEKQREDTVRNSKARLAEFYLVQNNLKGALAIFDEFVEYEELAIGFRVAGYAGRAIVFDRMNPSQFEGQVAEQMAKVRVAIGEVGTKTDKLNNFMLKRFNEVKSRLDAKTEELDQENREDKTREVEDSRRDSSRFFQLFPTLSRA
jgi:hypothetical protein